MVKFRILVAVIFSVSVIGCSSKSIILSDEEYRSFKSIDQVFDQYPAREIKVFYRVRSHARLVQPHLFAEGYCLANQGQFIQLEGPKAPLPYQYSQYFDEGDIEKFKNNTGKAFGTFHCKLPNADDWLVSLSHDKPRKDSDPSSYHYHTTVKIETFTDWNARNQLSTIERKNAENFKRYELLNNSNGTVCKLGRLVYKDLAGDLVAERGVITGHIIRFSQDKSTVLVKSQGWATESGKLKEQPSTRPLLNARESTLAGNVIESSITDWRPCTFETAKRY